MSRVLCLGAGLVARPYIRYLSEHGYSVVVASRTLKKAEQLIQGCGNAEAVAFDIDRDDRLLDKLTREADLVCSLLPYTYHVRAAKVAIRHRKHFCTTSYISKEMQELNSAAEDAGIVLLNECGVDPGIDHMSAMRIIHAAHRDGGKIESFTSFTGGLPAPDANNNPLGYKLSWSPRGVLLAGRNDAHFLLDGKEVVIPGSVLFDNCHLYEVPGLGVFEGYPNRDSMSYIDIYGIPETKTMLRGTFRNTGWCNTMKRVSELGLLDLTPRDLTNTTYAQMLSQLLGLKEQGLKSQVAHRLRVPITDPVITRLEWLGLFSSTRIPSEVSTPLDALCHLFEEKLQYSPGERDMIVMHHDFVIRYPNRRQRLTSTLIDYGIPHGESSMSRTVSLPVAIASRMILEGSIKLVGVQRPVMPEIYGPVLEELESLGITFTEQTSSVSAE
ncbi:MAG: saccharopine dehydrogenase NADP-binding domain-containing protein [Candidatus Thorarchaeota archaeon]|nr:saccharopine dehydrogenase NADP-binding domain-containing protein [Candidatus Thorarchaeota archaeon]